MPTVFPGPDLHAERERQDRRKDPARNRRRFSIRRPARPPIAPIDPHFRDLNHLAERQHFEERHNTAIDLAATSSKSTH